MLTQELLTQIDNVLPVLNEGSHVIDCAAKCASVRVSLFEHEAKILGTSDGDNIVRIQRIMVDTVQRGIKSIQVFTNPIRFVNEMRDAKSALDLNPLPNDSNDYLSNTLKRFEMHYGAYINAQTPPHAIDLIFSGYDVHTAVLGLRSTLKGIREELQPEKLEPNEESFELVFRRKMSPQDIADKLVALSALYDELCDIVNDHTPLRIGKLETGSLLIQLIGGAALALFYPLLKKAATILYRRYVTEGQLESLQDQQKILLEQIKITSALKESGEDTSDVNQALRQLNERQVAYMCVLLHGEGPVELNGEQVGGDITPRIGADAPPKRIEDQRTQEEKAEGSED